MPDYGKAIKRDIINSKILIKGEIVESSYMLYVQGKHLPYLSLRTLNIAVMKEVCLYISF